MLESHRRWLALVQRAQSGVDRCRAQWQETRKNEAALAASRTRVDSMVDDYQTRLALARREGHTMREDTNARRFLEQLAALRARIGDEQARTARACEAATLALTQAQAKLQKFEQLAESARKADQELRTRLEQKRNDEWALIAYQWREQ